MKVKEINIKDGMPPADVAVANLEIEIEALKNSDFLMIKVIHGYGSHGQGGEIKKLLRERLKQLKKLGKIKDYIEGEKWGKTVIEKYNIVSDFPQLILQSDMQLNNSGITLVMLNNK